MFYSSEVYGLFHIPELHLLQRTRQFVMPLLLFTRRGVQDSMLSLTQLSLGVRHEQLLIAMHMLNVIVLNHDRQRSHCMQLEDDYFRVSRAPRLTSLYMDAR
jgi:hypothetical protein